MVQATSPKISLYKELQVLQESPNGVKMVYTCYEAIPNGGFCVLSATPNTGAKITLKHSSYIKTPAKGSNNFPDIFFPTLIDAIKAYSLKSISSNNAS